MSPASPGRNDALMPPWPSDNTMQWLGWAGLLMLAPAQFRMAKIDGTGRKGLLVLADAQGPRLEISWAAVARQRFDAEKVLRRRLRRALRVNAMTLDERARRVDNASFEPLLMATDERRSLDRYVGYCPRTRRIIDCVYHHGTAREDAMVRRQTFAHIVDQPLDQPTRWAMFGLSFTAPPGYRYDAAVLNVGDMSVRVSRFEGEYRGPSITVRQIYPATIALDRQPLAEWMQMVLTPRRQMYALGRVLGRRPEKFLHPVQTSRGEGLYHEARFRWVMRLMFWRQPRLLGTWLIRDEQSDRLLCIQIADQQQRLATLLQQVLDGLHWADAAD